LGWHPVAVVQYTFTHKQYIKQHIRQKQKQQNLLIKRSADRAPSLRGISWHLPYNWGKRHGKTSVRVAGHFTWRCKYGALLSATELPLKHFRIILNILYCWQWHYLNNTHRPYSCIFVAIMVTCTRHNVTLHIHCLSSYLKFNTITTVFAT